MAEIEPTKKDRFVLRVSPSLYAAINDLAETENRSFNGEVCTALNKWLYKRDSTILVKERLLAMASLESFNRIREATPPYLLKANDETDSCKTTVRLKESLEYDLREAWNEHKFQEGYISLNSFLKVVVSWWLMCSFQLAECTKALHREFSSSMMPPAGIAAIGYSSIDG
jgi:hypothetical protein